MKTVRLKSLVHNITEKSSGEPATFVGLEEIESETGKLRTTELPIKKTEDSLVHAPGDVLFSKLRPYLAKSFTPKATGTATNELLVLRPSAHIESRYLLYCSLSKPWIEWATATSYGTKMPRTSWELMGDYEVHLPDTAEQRRITDFLDAETSRIDALLGLRSKQLRALEERAYAEVTEVLLPGTLTSATEQSPYPWLPEIPTDKPFVKLGLVCSLQNGLTVDANRSLHGDVVTRPYLRVANVQAGHLKLDNISEITVPRTVAARSTLRVGDVLTTEGGDLDKLGRGTVWRGELPECLHQNHIFALRPNTDRLLGEYLALMTQTLHGRCYFESTGAKTTNLASTNSSKILGFKIPLPDVDEQRQLVQTAQQRLNQIERVKILLKQQATLLRERRRALITAAVTGKFDVSTASGRGIED